MKIGKNLRHVLMIYDGPDFAYFLSDEIHVLYTLIYYLAGVIVAVSFGQLRISYQILMCAIELSQRSTSLSTSGFNFSWRVTYNWLSRV